MQQDKGFSRSHEEGCAAVEEVDAEAGGPVPIGLLLFPPPELRLIASFDLVEPFVRGPLGTTDSTSKVQSFC